MPLSLLSESAEEESLRLQRRSRSVESVVLVATVDLAADQPGPAVGVELIPFVGGHPSASDKNMVGNFLHSRFVLNLPDNPVEVVELIHNGGSDEFGLEHFSSIFVEILAAEVGWVVSDWNPSTFGSLHLGRREIARDTVVSSRVPFDSLDMFLELGLFKANIISWPSISWILDWHSASAVARIPRMIA